MLVVRYALYVLGAVRARSVGAGAAAAERLHSARRVIWASFAYRPAVILLTILPKSPPDVVLTPVPGGTLSVARHRQNTFCCLVDGEVTVRDP